MRSKTLIVAVICAFTGAMLLSGVATPSRAKKAKNEKNEKNCKNKKGKNKKCKKGKKGKPVAVGKVAICDQTGNGSYDLIVVGAPAAKAHLSPGDAFPGAQVRADPDQNCQAPQPPPRSRSGTRPGAGVRPVRVGRLVLLVGHEGSQRWRYARWTRASGRRSTCATVGGSTTDVPALHVGTCDTPFVVQNDDTRGDGLRRLCPV